MKRAQRKITFTTFLAIHVLVISMFVSSEGCIKHVSNTPPGVNSSEVAQWYEATGALYTISDLALNGVQILKNLHDNKLIEDEYYVSGLRGFGTISSVGLSTVGVLKQAPNHFDATTKQQVFNSIQVIINEVTVIINSGSVVKNKQSVASVNAVLASIQLALNVINNVTRGAVVANGGTK